MIEQIFNIWKFFKSNDVRYITIGGFAVNIYGYSRNTGDLDILIEDTIENRRNFRKALKEIGIGDFESIETMQFVPGWTDFTLDFGLRLDVMTTIKGLENIPFGVLLNEATIVMIGDIPVNFIDYDNLIIAKKASNRPKDQLDIKELEKLKKDNPNP
jgi:predicted nucleotidyltransferase